MRSWNNDSNGKLTKAFSDRFHKNRTLTIEMLRTMVEAKLVSVPQTSSMITESAHSEGRNRKPEMAISPLPTRSDRSETVGFSIIDRGATTYFDQDITRRYNHG